jgi:hypothetical protein
MKSGIYPLTIRLYDDEDNLTKITSVKYYRGFTQTLEEPGEEAYVKAHTAEDKDGVEIETEEELDDLDINNADEIDRAWNDKYGDMI